MAQEDADIREKKLEEFVRRLRDSAGSNLHSVILYGSAVSREFDPQLSDLNLVCVLGQSSYKALQDIAPVIAWWSKQKQLAPLLLNTKELERSADVFAIELTDMRARYRVLFGEDVLKTLQVPIHLHRAQLKYELREKLILLRQRLVFSAGNDRETRDLLLHSLPSFATLFRHALIAEAQPVPATKRETIQALAARLGFDASAFYELLDVREHKIDPKKLDVRYVATRYLATVEQVTATVDKMLDSPGPRGS
jgi:predicted nucleotidyltransferase